MLSNIHNDFLGRGITSIDSSKGILHGRPFGGLGIIWRKSLGFSCTVKQIDSDSRLFAIEIDCNGIMLSILNVYLPYDDGTNEDQYIRYLTEVNSFLEINPYSCAVGDFNANTRQRTRFGKMLVDFCTDENLTLSDVLLCENDSFTYVSEAHNYKEAWLDHVVTTHTTHRCIDKLWIDYDYVTSDHLPVFLNIQLPIPNNSSGNASNSHQSQSNNHRINWSKMSANEYNHYKENSRQELSKIHINRSLILCEDIRCNSPSHKAAIESLHGEIVSSLRQASTNLTTQITKTRGLGQPEHIPGWRKICSELHSYARSAFLFWRASGSPKHGPIYESMRTSRARFKQALRQCRKDNRNRLQWHHVIYFKCIPTI